MAAPPVGARPRGGPSMSISTLIMMKRRMADARQRANKSKPPVRIENTYRMEPTKDQRPPPTTIKEIIDKSLAFFLDSSTYKSPEMAAKNAKIVADDLRRKMVSQMTVKCSRYKWIIQVTVLPNDHSGVLIASRTVSDTATDGHVCVNYANKKGLAAIVTIHWFYFE